MSRITQIDPETATGRAKERLDAVKGKLGLVPNMTRVMANAPAVLDGYLQSSGALDKGTLSTKAREQIALALAQANGCDYPTLEDVPS
jgi:alkylhydroperoxidase family enzyme